MAKSLLEIALLSLVTGLLGPSLAAQDERPPVREPESTLDRLSEKDANRGKTLAQIRAERLFPGGGTYVAFQVDFQPRRVAPGGAGTMTVTMMLMGDKVLPAPPAVSFEHQQVQGPISFGSPVFRSANLGTKAPGYSGRPVFDDYAIIDVPFRVKAGTRPGKYLVHMVMLYDLFNGENATFFGHLKDSAGGRVVVGEPMMDRADGSVRPAGASGTGDEPGLPGASEAVVPVTAAAGGGAGERAGSTSGDGGLDPVTPVRAGEPASREADSGFLLLEESSSGFLMAGLASAFFLILVTVLVLARKRA